MKIGKKKIDGTCNDELSFKVGIEILCPDAANYQNLPWKQEFKCLLLKQG